jgi:hypothetical protein
MKELFYMGGPLFMGILTGELILLIAWAAYHSMPVILKKDFDSAKSKSHLKHIKTIGTFALVTGILAQLIGFYEAFDAIETAGDISPSLLMGGLKVSLITTLYGFFIYLFSLLIWLIMDLIIPKKTE